MINFNVFNLENNISFILLLYIVDSYGYIVDDWGMLGMLFGEVGLDSTMLFKIYNSLYMLFTMFLNI